MSGIYRALGAKPQTARGTAWSIALVTAYILGAFAIVAFEWCLR